MWDENCVVYNAASGQTHLLDPVPALIIRKIEEGCSSSEDLFRQIANALDVDLNIEVRNTLEQTLLQLDKLGLIEPAT